MTGHEKTARLRSHVDHGDKKMRYQRTSEKPYLDQLRRYAEGKTTGGPDPLYMAGKTLSRNFILFLVNERPDVIEDFENLVRGGK